MSEIAGIPFLRISDDGYLQTITQPRPGNEKYFFAPNLCDKRAWYTSATQYQNFSMTDSGDLTTWNTNGTHTHWIDLKHGRVFLEDRILLESPEFAVLVETSIDSGNTWVEKTENTWRLTDADFDIDYNSGEITFNSPLASGTLVRASFFKANDNYEWSLSPSNGKKVKALYVEVQFTSDIQYTNIVEYEIWGYNPNDLPNKMVYVTQAYKRIQDFYQESTGPYPAMPAFGGAEAGLQSSMITLPFKYLAYRELKSSEGAEVRMKLKNPGPLGGEFASITFYCLTEDE